jgi:3-deoxy-D-manno-octulosonic-acid transferase
MFLMLWFYRVMFVPLMLVAAPYYLWRMRKRGGYRDGFGQRFGAVDALPVKRAGVKRIWLQAVSVGEMLAIAPVLEALAKRGDVEIYLTTTTSTGYTLACERYRALTIGIGYFPMDGWFFSARAWKRVTPDLAILTEGERWPEFIAQARRRGVPLIALNGRLSDRSFRRMRAWRWAVRPLMRGITRVLACSEHDAARFRELGFPAACVSSTGNIKLDVTIPLLSETDKAKLRVELGLGRGAGAASESGVDRSGAGPGAVPVLLGSSTWPGEEAALVGALRSLREAGITARLLLVPRHAERREEVEAALKETGLSFHLRSRGAAPADVDVAVGDTTGELRKFTQLADVVFVGKSLPPHGEGQTPVEAAALGRAILFGPGMSNFRPISRELLESGAARVVHDAEELAVVATLLFRDAGARAAMAAAAQGWHRANQGAVARSLAALDEELRKLL